MPLLCLYPGHLEYENMIGKGTENICVNMLMSEILGHTVKIHNEFK